MTMLQLHSLIAILAASLLLAGATGCSIGDRNDKETIVAATPLTQAELNRQREAGERIIAEISAAGKRGDSVYRIPPGEYRFPDRGNWSLIHLNGLRNLTIDARDVTFWLEAWKFGLFITECENLTIEGLRIDYDPIPYSQGTIVRIHENGRPEDWFIDYHVDPGFPDADAIDFDPILQRKAEPLPLVIFDRDGGNILLNKWGRPRAIAALGNNTFRIHVAPSSIDAPPAQAKENPSFSDYGVESGDRLVLTHRTSGSAVLIRKCTKTTLREVKVHSSPGGAFTEVGHYAWAGGQIFDRCVVDRRPGTKNLLSTNSDAYHSSLSPIGPTISGCTARYVGDDMVNIRGTLAIVLSTDGKRNLDICLRAAHEAESILHPGARLTFIARDSGQLRGEVRITSVGKSQDQNLKKDFEQTRPQLGVHSIGSNAIYRLELDRDITLSPYDYIAFDDSIGAGFRVVGNRFEHGLVNGIVLQSRNGVVRDNEISDTSRSGIKLVMYFQWLEGALCHDVLIENNRLLDVDTKGKDRSKSAAAVFVGTEQRLNGGPAPSAVHHSSIVLRGNHITTRGTPLRIGQARNIVIQGNDITLLDRATPVGEIGLGDWLIGDPDAIDLSSNTITTTSSP